MGIVRTVAEKTAVAVLVAGVLTVGGGIATFTLGWWDVVSRPWTAAVTLSDIEESTAKAISPLEAEISALSADLQFIVVNTPPLKVVNWDTAAYRQIGACTLDQCLVSVEGARTDYGDTCGQVVAAGGEIRIDDEDAIRFDYGADFNPKRLTKVPKTIRIPLNLPTVTTKGEHEWRSWATYSECAGPGEPKDRYSPWYRLVVE